MTDSMPPRPDRSPEVSVIIASTCESSRSPLIERAIDSVLRQQGIPYELLFVVNGDRFDPSLLQRLKDDNRLRTLQMKEAHVSRARFHGVCESSSEFLCFLDDDDEFLPGALSYRVECMRAKPDIDVLVTNGYFFIGADTLLVDADLARTIREDQERSFLTTNWFASPAALFRRSTLGTAFFDLPYKYFEWTYLFFKLTAAGKKIQYSDVATYRKFEDHPLAISKSKEYGLAYPNFLRDLLKLRLSKDTQSQLRDRNVKALRSAVSYHMRQRELRLALGYFFRWFYSSASTSVLRLLDRGGSSRRLRNTCRGSSTRGLTWLNPSQKMQSPTGPANNRERD